MRFCCMFKLDAMGKFVSLKNLLGKTYFYRYIDKLNEVLERNKKILFKTICVYEQLLLHCLIRIHFSWNVFWIRAKSLLKITYYFLVCSWFMDIHNFFIQRWEKQNENKNKNWCGRISGRHTNTHVKVCTVTTYVTLMNHL